MLAWYCHRTLANLVSELNFCLLLSKTWCNIVRSDSSVASLFTVYLLNLGTGCINLHWQTSRVVDLMLILTFGRAILSSCIVHTGAPYLWNAIKWILGDPSTSLLCTSIVKISTPFAVNLFIVIFLLQKVCLMSQVLLRPNLRSSSRCCGLGCWHICVQSLCWSWCWWCECWWWIISNCDNLILLVSLLYGLCGSHDLWFLLYNK